MPPQVITDDLAALDVADAATTAAHSALNTLTDEQAAILNSVADAAQKLKDLDAAQQAALDKTIADIKDRYGVAPPAVVEGGPVPLMTAMADPLPPVPAPHVGPFRALWAWVVANPDKALKILSWLALLFGIPLPLLKSQIEAMKK